MMSARCRCIRRLSEEALNLKLLLVDCGGTGPQPLAMHATLFVESDCHVLASNDDMDEVFDAIKEISLEPNMFTGNMGS